MFHIRRPRVRRDFDDVLQVAEQFLLDRFLQAFVRVHAESQPPAHQTCDGAQNPLPELPLRVLRHPDLIFNAAHQSFIRIDILARDRVLHLFPVAVGFHVVDVVVHHRLRRLFVRVDESALNLFLGGVVELLSNLVDEAHQSAPLLVAVRVFGDSVSQRTQHVDRRHVGFSALHERRRHAIDDKSRGDAVHPLVQKLFVKLLHMTLIPIPDLLFTVVQLHLRHYGKSAAFARFQARHDSEHRGYFEGVGRDMNRGEVKIAALVSHIRLPDELLIDANLLGDSEIIGEFDDEDSVDHRLVLFVGEVGVVLILVGVRDDRYIAVDECEAARLNRLLSCHCVQFVEETFLRLQHLDELHDSAISDIEFAVEVVGARVGLLPELRERLNIDAARQLRDVLTLRIRRLESADAHAVLLGEKDSLDWSLVDIAFPLRFKPVSAHRAEVAFDVDAEVRLEISPHLVGNEVQRFLVHWAALDGVARARFGFAVELQPLFDERDKGGFAAADWPHKHQDSFADVESTGGGVQVLFHKLLKRALQSVKVVKEKFVLAGAVRIFLVARLHNHVVEARVGEVRHLRSFGHDFKVVRERSLPRKSAFLSPLFVHLLQKVCGFDLLHARIPSCPAIVAC